ncbi:MAG TPA: LysR family transcriptional regulator [Steroidobacteraceae bacterium]|nr:LysR family transcriptional regulator [Steroidobacteraceae bacterium]
MALDPRQLRAFIAIVKTGSLGLAAETLHVTQPALSRIIRRLETQLGVPLFERRTTGMELTSFGHALLPHATFLSEEASLAIEQINSLRGLGQGTIRIGAVASAAIMVLPGVLDRVLTQWPNVHVQILEAVEDVLTVALTNNAIDVAISGPIPESEEIVQVAEHKFTDRYSVICSAANELQQRANLSIHDIIDVPWVMPAAEAEPRRMFNALISRLGVAPPRVVVETRSPSVIKAMVANTHFLGWLPEPLFAAEQAAGLIKALAVKEMAPQRRFFVFRRRRNFMPPPVVKFLEALKV